MQRHGSAFLDDLLYGFFCHSLISIAYVASQLTTSGLDVKRKSGLKWGGPDDLGVNRIETKFRKKRKSVLLGSILSRSLVSARSTSSILINIITFVIIVIIIIIVI